MSLPDQTPKLSKLPFLIGDAALLGAAWFIAEHSRSPLSANAILGIVACVAVGAILGAIPFLTDYARKQDEALDERQRGLEALSRTVNTAAEQISIAANGFHEITETSHRNLKQAEQLPQKLQEKIAEFKAQLDNARDDEREDLEKEVAELRAGETDRLQAAADKIQKALAELTKLDAAVQKQLSARSDLLNQTNDTLAKAQLEASAAFSDAVAAVTRELSAAQTKAVAEIDTKLGERTTAALAAIEAATAAARASLAALPPPPAPAVVAPIAPAEVPPAPAHTEPVAPPKRPRKSRREEPPGAETPAPEPITEPVAAEPAAPLAVTPEPAPAASEPAIAPEPAAVDLPPAEPTPTSPPAETPAEPVVEAAPAPEPTPLAPVETTVPEPVATPAEPTPAPTPEPAAEPIVASAPPTEEPITPPPAAEAPVVPPPPAERPPRKRTRKVDPEPTLDLSLDLGGEGFGGAASEDSQVAPPEANERVLSSDGATRLIATAYIGIGNRLFIRGDGPGLSWDKGVPLQFISIGKWRWETTEATAPIAFKLFKNDELECAALGRQTLDPGYQQEVAAKF